MLKTIHFGQTYYAFESNQFSTAKGWKKAKIGVHEPKICKISGRAYHILEKKTRILPFSFERVANFCLGFFAAVLSLGCALYSKTIRQLLTGRQIVIIVAPQRAVASAIIAQKPTAPLSVEKEKVVFMGEINEKMPHSHIQELNDQVPYLIETFRKGKEEQELRFLAKTHKADLLKALFPPRDWEMQQIEVSPSKNFTVALLTSSSQEPECSTEFSKIEKNLCFIQKDTDKQKLTLSYSASGLPPNNSRKAIKLRQLYLEKLRESFPQSEWEIVFHGFNCISLQRFTPQKANQALEMIPSLVKKITETLENQKIPFSNGKAIDVPCQFNVLSQLPSFYQALEKSILKVYPIPGLKIAYPSSHNIRIWDINAMLKRNQTIILQNLEPHLTQIVSVIKQTLEDKKTEVARGETIKIVMPKELSVPSDSLVFANNAFDKKISILYPKPEWDISGYVGGSGIFSITIRNTAQSLENGKAIWEKLEPKIRHILIQKDEVYVDVIDLNPIELQGIKDALTASIWDWNSDYNNFFLRVIKKSN